MNKIDNSGQGIAALGRGGDKFIAHMTKGEMAIPPVISDSTKAIIRKEMESAGLDLNEYTVGEGMSINPITGMAEFGFLKKLAKKVKKVVKKIAPIAAVIPGPWQSFAVVYQKGAAALKIAKGEGGLGDLMTLAAGGNQSVFGKDGALKNITSGAFKTAGGGFGEAFKSIGSVTDAAGKSSFKPFEYGQNVMKSKASDLKQGFGGLLGGNAGKFNVNTGQMDYFTSGYKDIFGNVVSEADFLKMPASDQALHTRQFGTQGFNPLKGISPMNNVPDQYVNAAGKTITPDAFRKLPASDQAAFVPNASGGSFLGGKSVGEKLSSMFLPQGVEDALGTGPGGQGILSGKGGGSGIDPKMAALALLYGKAVKDYTQKTSGGLRDVRNSIRSDLNPQPVFQGFDLGIRKNAANGGEMSNRQYFRDGGLAMIAEQDMRDGGESEGPGTGTSDDIPAMLSDGEFVMTAAANKGSGGFEISKTKTGIELIPGKKPNRKKGVENMNRLMSIFEDYNSVGRMA